MTTAALKMKIKALIDKEQDARKLELAYRILTEDATVVSEPVAAYGKPVAAKAKSAGAASTASSMRDAVAVSEREFAAGKGIPLSRFEKQMDSALDELFPVTNKKAKARSNRAPIADTKRAQK